MSASPLVLLHGLNNTPAIWDGVAERLQDGMPVLAPALPALPDIDAIAGALLASLPERFWLAGFSFGGYVALAMLERAPERVLGLALICTTPEADTPAQNLGRRAAILATVDGGEEEGSAPTMAAAYVERTLLQGAGAFHPLHRNDSALQQKRREMLEAYGPRSFIAHALACLTRPARSALLRAPLQLLWVAGSDDPLYPSQAVAAMQERAGTGTLRVLGPAGHLVPLEQPQALASALASWIRG